MTIRDLLKGCTPGNVQRVGIMTVIPLIAKSTYQDRNFIPPTKILIRNSSYGELQFVNNEDKAVIVPAHATYYTKEAVQDHAMAKTGVVPAKKDKLYSDAMCVQSTQSGHFRSSTREVSILPWSLREFATMKRGVDEYSKLWPVIAKFNKESGVPDSGSHLIKFYNKFKEQLEDFVAQFEVVKNQVGAIILINGTVFGVERTPNALYFKAIFETLIRDCYGAAALRVSQGINLVKSEEYNTYPKMDDNVSSIADVKEALKKAKLQEVSLAKAVIGGLLDDVLSEKLDESNAEATVKTITNDQLIGQTIVADSGNPVYTSAVVKKDWLKKQKWFKAPMFEM